MTQRNLVACTTNPVITWFCILGSSKGDSNEAMQCWFTRTRLREERALHQLWLPFPSLSPARLALHHPLSMDVLLCVYTQFKENINTTVLFPYPKTNSRKVQQRSQATKETEQWNRRNAELGGFNLSPSIRSIQKYHVTK